MFQKALSLLQQAPLMFQQDQGGRLLTHSFQHPAIYIHLCKHAHAEGMKGNSNSITLLKCLWNQKQERNQITPKDSKTQEAECQSLYVQ